MNYRVILEMEVDSDDPLSAANQVAEWCREFDTNLQYYVQQSKSGDVFSVDLSEEDEDAVQEVDNYIPLIN